MQDASTISLRADLKDQLTDLKRHLKESYNDVIERLLALAVDEAPVNEETLAGIKKSIREIRKGNLIPKKEVMEKYGVR